MFDDARVFIIAEAGVNHNGSVENALRLVDAAAEARADAVKFQTFRADLLATDRAPKAAYQLKATAADESQRVMLRRLQLDRAAHRAIAARCQERGIMFLSTPFDLESLALVSGELNIPAIKIGSGDLTNGPLLHAAARTRKPLILSTGMASLEDIDAALAVVAHGYLGGDSVPIGRVHARAGLDEAQRAVISERVVLLQCTTAYPTAPADLNLRAMDTLRRRFGTRVGLSDHSAGISASIAAAALGASLIEKHFTLDRRMPGPDHAASIEPDALMQLVIGIREVEEALGSGDKQPVAAEISNAAAVRKSLVAVAAVRKGERFSPQNLGVMRPGTGVSPMMYWDWLGREAGRDYAVGELVDQ